MKVLGLGVALKGGWRVLKNDLLSSNELPNFDIFQSERLVPNFIYQSEVLGNKMQVLIFKTRGHEAFTRMIFFKFSGISLVSVGRVRPGNEIKSKMT